MKGPRRLWLGLLALAAFACSGEHLLGQGLYNKTFEVYDGEFNFRDDKVDIVNKIKGELGRGISHVNVDLDWGGGGHAVEVTKIENGRVFFRNPHGPAGVGATGTIQGSAANNTGNGPLRRTEDGARAIQSMSLADFEKAVRDTYLQVGLNNTLGRPPIFGGGQAPGEAARVA